MDMISKAGLHLNFPIIPRIRLINFNKPQIAMRILFPKRTKRGKRRKRKGTQHMTIVLRILMNPKTSTTQKAGNDHIIPQ